MTELTLTSASLSRIHNVIESSNRSDQPQLTSYAILYDSQAAAEFAEDHRDFTLGPVAPISCGDLNIFVGRVTTHETISLQLTDQVEEMSHVVFAAKKLYSFSGARRLERLERSFAELLSRLAVVNNYFSTNLGYEARDDIPSISRSIERLLGVLREAVREVTKNASGLARQHINQREARVDSVSKPLKELMNILDEVVPVRFEEDFRESILSNSKRMLEAAKERPIILPA